MSITDTPEYSIGWEWATEHGPLLAELFTGQDVSTPELRTRLFKEASRRWPSESDDLANDLKQVAFVAGGMKAAVQALTTSREAQEALFEAALQATVMWSSARGKAEAFSELKAKPDGWWRSRMGTATPNNVVNALSVAWRHDLAKQRGRRNPRSRWETLIDTLGVREMSILAEATSIVEHLDVRPRYVIESPDHSFEIISRPVYEDGQMIRYPGEITG